MYIYICIYIRIIQSLGYGFKKSTPDKPSKSCHTFAWAISHLTSYLKTYRIGPFNFFSRINVNSWLSCVVLFHHVTNSLIGGCPETNGFPIDNDMVLMVLMVLVF